MTTQRLNRLRDDLVRAWMLLDGLSFAEGTRRAANLPDGQVEHTAANVRRRLDEHLRLAAMTPQQVRRMAGWREQR